MTVRLSSRRSPEIGQFISPDTLVPNPGDVQSFDRYAYTLNNPLKYTDPTGHQATCMLDENNTLQCNGNAVVGGHTVSSPMSTITGNTFSDDSGLSLPQILAGTSNRIVERLKNAALTYNEDGTIDWNATLGNTIGSDLADCARLAGGTCGLSIGGSQGAGGGVRYSLDFFVDQEGHFDVLATGGGGAYIPPLAILSGNLALATHIETGSVSVAVMKNAAIGDMRGWFGQFGAGFAAGHGVSTEWIVGRNSKGEIMHGLAVAGTQGSFLDIHLTTTYSVSGHDAVGHTQDGFGQLLIAR